ncbi:SMP-30/gluconolactonase/LRE family protein [Maribacter algarum]|uniref:SMP-30/gluconolactonase/LRE family protein n=1 Tax=Maribacter algarum (ex Zhang et al. 2020) TaxID=2578118 RepID=A0A5S3PGR1_9FLAO|nr:SMP-30/gluconolactonase/LRE family protein [Maribacter algarum]TMM53295.1 SMP-30/gluconolactonase/LRE family protein [Maribacter algarum]
MKSQNKTLFVFALLITLSSCKAQTTSIIKEGAELTLVADGYDFTEGPAVDKNGDVYFTDQPNDRIVKWDASDNSVSDWMKPSGRSNGLYFDLDGNLIACADEKNEIWRIDVEKNITVLVKDFENKKLNGPNDLWIDTKGGIYLTDPHYKRPYWNRTQDTIPKRVYYLSPDNEEISIAAENYSQPNGIIGIPDGKTLYVADIGYPGSSSDKKTYSYSIQADGSLINKRVFCEMGSDGMTIDNKGNVYLTGNGVTVFNSNGKQIEHIKIPEAWTANVTFGGPNQDILFITAMDSVYTLEMNVNGIR